MRLFKTLILFVTLTGVSAASAASPTSAPAITSEEWQELTRDPAFNYRTEIELQETVTTNPGSSLFSRILHAIVSFFDSPWGRTFLWTILVLSLCYLVYKTIQRYALMPVTEKKVRQTMDDKKAPDKEELLEGDWNSLAEQASNAEDYRLAIRYAYLDLLQYLQERNILNYRPDKTNNDYYYELKAEELRSAFRTVSRQYEYAWYGNYPVPQQGFMGYLEYLKRIKTMADRG